MLRFIENLPVELVGKHVLGYLSLQDIVLLERSCGSKKSHQLFLNLIPYCSPVVVPSRLHTDTSVIEWFSKRQCKISSLTIRLPGNNPCLHVKNLQVKYYDLEIKPRIKIESLIHVLKNDIASNVNSIQIHQDQNIEVIEELSACTANVKILYIDFSNNSIEWLTVDILSRWKLTECDFTRLSITTSFIMLVVQTCTELTSIKLNTSNIDDSAVIAIAQHCPKLETLMIYNRQITYTSLLALSERSLPLKELYP